MEIEDIMHQLRDEIPSYIKVTNQLKALEQEKDEAERATLDPKGIMNRLGGNASLFNRLTADQKKELAQAEQDYEKARDQFLESSDRYESMMREAHEQRSRVHDLRNTYLSLIQICPGDDTMFHSIFEKRIVPIYLGGNDAGIVITKATSEPKGAMYFDNPKSVDWSTDRKIEELLEHEVVGLINASMSEVRYETKYHEVKEEKRYGVPVTWAN